MKELEIKSAFGIFTKLVINFNSKVCVVMSKICLDFKGIKTVFICVKMDLLNNKVMSY